MYPIKTKKMFKRGNPRIGQELLDVPMGDMIRDMAFAIAEAQMKLDANSIEVAQMMGGLQTITETINGEEVVTFKDSRVFFGKEKLTLSEAIDLHNSTNDAELKATIKSNIGNSNYEVDISKVKAINETAAIFTGTNANTVNAGSSYTYSATVALKSPSTSSTAPLPTTVSRTDSTIIYQTNDTPAIYYRFLETKNGKNLYEKVEPSIKKTAAASETTIYVPSRVSMLELGFSPTFYQFIDTIIEVKISIKYTSEGSSTVATNTSEKNGRMNFLAIGPVAGAKRSVVTTQVNASYSQKYSYSAEGSSLLRTKLVPIPPPAILEERIRQQMELAKEQNTTS